MFSKKNTKKAFTLIEMLIVIVIIGILMAALIPRLSSARGRANDVARKSHLSQVATALISYQIDHGKFPVCDNDPLKWCILDDIKDDLIGAGLSSIPTDPDTQRKLDVGIEGVSTTAWQYGYITIEKRGIANNGFVLMAATETAWWSNWVATDGGSDWIETILQWTDFVDIIQCKDITIANSSENTAGACKYVENDDELRYIYVY